MQYSTDKPPRDDNCNYKPIKPHRNTPSFSSTLLDEIYNSIDGNEQKANGLKVFDEKPLTKFGSVGGDPESTARVKVAAVRRRISLMSELERSALQERDMLFFSSTNPNEELFERKNKTGNDQTMKTKSKSRVYNKVYAGLKKVKQPISPGGKLTSFINSLFGDKKSKKMEKGDKVMVEQQARDPSSVSSRSTVEMRDGLQRTVRFHPPLPPPNISEDEDFSDASSDLFELDHKAMFGKSRFHEELSVYENAYFVKNRMI